LRHQVEEALEKARVEGAVRGCRGDDYARFAHGGDGVVDFRRLRAGEEGVGGQARKVDQAGFIAAVRE
jgi:hypothetical protein